MKLELETKFNIGDKVRIIGTTPYRPLIIYDISVWVGRALERPLIRYGTIDQSSNLGRTEISEEDLEAYSRD